MRNKRTFFVLFAFAGLVLSACDQGAEATEEGFVPVVVDDFNVIAEGRLVPNRYVELAFGAPGLVQEVMFAEGDIVAEGDVLAVLDNKEQLRANLAQAQFSLEQANLELLNAQQALDDLFENHEVLVAQAQQNIALGQDQLNQANLDLGYLNNPDIEYYQDEVEDKREELFIAMGNEEITSFTDQSGVVDRAQENYDDFLEILNHVKDQVNDCVPADTDDDGVIDFLCDPNRFITYKFVRWTLEDAQEAFDDAANVLREAQIQLGQAQIGDTNAIDQAREDLEDAEQDLNWATNDPDAIDLALREADLIVAEANLAESIRNWEKIKDSPDADDVEMAEGRITQAEAQIANAEAAYEAAQAALDDGELRAPWSGTIANLDLMVGEHVSPGVLVLTLADFTSWIVETDNLTEIEVPDVAVGQSVLITPDALPDLEIAGEVESIGGLYVEKRGDITYTVIIRIIELDERFRWGMTVVTNFDSRS